MAYDATLRNLAVIGEAARALPQDARELSPQTPWPAIAGLRNCGSLRERSHVVRRLPAERREADSPL